MAGTDTSLGTARLDIAVNLTDYEASISKAKNLSDGLGKAAEEAFAQASGQSKKAATSLLNYAEGIDKTNDQFRIFKAAQKGVDTPLLSAVDAKIKAIRENLSKAAKETENAARQDAFVRSVEKQAAAIGKTRSELLELEAAELGLTSRLAPQIAALKAQENALFGTTTKLNAYGLSTKQVAAALRGVPAQITDIAVSLQGGQNPLTVLLQQGGQLKDLFGGIVPAAKALGGQLLALVNPYTVLAAVIATAAVAWNQADKEARAFANAVTLAGPGLGATEGQLVATAQSLEKLGISAGTANAAVVQVALSGKFTADQLTEVARAAILFEQATGQAIDATIADFARLSKDPVKGILELNEKYHFLTDAVYQQIKALQDQGREQEAVDLAIKTGSEVLAQRSTEVIKNVNLMSSAWKRLKLDVLDAWDSIKFAVSDTTAVQKAARELSAAQKELAFSQAKLAEAKTATFKGFFDIPQLEKNVADAKRAIASAESTIANDPGAKNKIADQAKQRANEASIAIRNELVQYQSDEQKRAAAIIKLRGETREAIKNAEIAGDKALAKTIRDNAELLEKEIIAKGAKKPKDQSATIRAIDNANNKADLQQFKDQLSEEQSAIQNNSRILQAEFNAKLISASEFYAKSKQLVEQDMAAQEKAITGQIAVLRERNITGKDSIDNQRQLATLESQLTKVRADAATTLKILGIQEDDRALKQKQAIEAYKQSLDNTTLALKQQNDLKLLRIALSDKEYEKQAQLISITADFTRELQKLNNELARGSITQEVYDADLEALKKSNEEKLKEINRFYDKAAQAGEDWLGGLKKGIKQWVDQAGTVAEQTAAITQRAMDTIVDGLVDAATTGKLAWKDMLADILKQIAAFLIKQAVVAFVNLILNAFGVGTSSVGSSGGGGAGESTGSGIGSAIGSIGKSSPAGTTSISPISPIVSGKSAGVTSNSNIQVNINTTLNSNGKSSSDNKNTDSENSSAINEFTDRMKNVANQEIQRAMQPGGSLWKVGVSV